MTRRKTAKELFELYLDNPSPGSMEAWWQVEKNELAAKERSQQMGQRVEASMGEPGTYAMCMEAMRLRVRDRGRSQPQKKIHRLKRSVLRGGTPVPKTPPLRGVRRQEA